MSLYWRRFLIAVLIVLAAGTVQIAPAPAQEATPWPTAGWETSTPEEQGMDSALLAKLFEQIESEDYAIQGVVLVRHGRLVAEAYRAPATPETKHHVYSCTKSFTSSLIGIAIDQGYLTGVDQRVMDFFPGRTFENVDDAKRGMTLDNLLTMSGGFEWEGGILESPTLDKLWSSRDWVQFMLDLPLSDPPGSRFVYNSGGSHLLSAILQQAAGMTAEDFAADVLFAPLGITDWSWRSDPKGISTGGWGLFLTPRDMAKFGYLYLHGGAWDGQQVVAADWVADSTRAHIAAGSGWLAEDYGYQWWIDGNSYFMALGYAGQYIIVMPERDLVVTFTSDLPTRQFFVPENLFNTFVIPASESLEALPANPDGNAALQAAIDALAE